MRAFPLFFESDLSFFSCHRPCHLPITGGFKVLFPFDQALKEGGSWGNLTQRGREGGDGNEVFVLFFLAGKKRTKKSENDQGSRVFFLKNKSERERPPQVEAPRRRDCGWRRGRRRGESGSSSGGRAPAVGRGADGRTTRVVPPAAVADGVSHRPRQRGEAAAVALLEGLDEGEGEVAAERGRGRGAGRERGRCGGPFRPNCRLRLDRRRRSCPFLLLDVRLLPPRGGPPGLLAAPGDQHHLPSSSGSGSSRGGGEGGGKSDGGGSGRGAAPCDRSRRRGRRDPVCALPARPAVWPVPRRGRKVETEALGAAPVWGDGFESRGTRREKG